jgi:hypothetical protein
MGTTAFILHSIVTCFSCTVITSFIHILTPNLLIITPISLLAVLGMHILFQLTGQGLIKSVWYWISQIIPCVGVCILTTSIFY